VADGPGVWGLLARLAHMTTTASILCEFDYSYFVPAPRCLGRTRPGRLPLVPAFLSDYLMEQVAYVLESSTAGYTSQALGCRQVPA
jgi:hypothetical protein